MPSNFRSGNGAVTLAVTRARALHKMSGSLRAVCLDFQAIAGPGSGVVVGGGSRLEVPSFAQLDICCAIVLPKSYFQRTKGIKGAVIEANIFL